MRKKCVFTDFLKSSCNMTSLNLRLHCGNLFWIALSLNFYHFIPSLSCLLPSFHRDWHPGCVMPDLQSRLFCCTALTKAPANFSGLPWRSHTSVSTNYMTGLYIQMKICNQSTLSSNSNILKRTSESGFLFIFGLWTSARTSHSALLIWTQAHWQQLYTPRHTQEQN